jgi:excisionase family DNA binding protein
VTSLLTARAVAEVLGVSSETVLRWTRRGDLPAIRLPGGAIRFDRDALDRWLEQRATGADESSHEPDAPAARREDTATTLRGVTNPDPELGVANEED